MLSTLPYHSHSQTAPRSHAERLCFQRALTLHGVSKSIAYSTVLTRVSSAGRTLCSFHMGWQKLTHIQPASTSWSPGLCSQGCTKARTLLQAQSSLWQEPHLSLSDLCFATAVTTQHASALHQLSQQALHTECALEPSATSNGVKTQRLSSTSDCRDTCRAGMAELPPAASSELQEVMAQQTTDQQLCWLHPKPTEHRRGLTQAVASHVTVSLGEKAGGGGTGWTNRQR